jgi:tetratricopeptide (TPR) repeat protein
MPFSLPVWLRSIGKRRDLMIGVPAVAVLLAALTAFVFYPAWKGGRHWQHAEQALAARDFAAASAQLRCYLEIHPTKAAAHFLQARTLRRAGRFAEAESALDQARRLDWVPEQLELEETLARVQRHGAHGEDLHRLVGFVDARHPTSASSSRPWRTGIATPCSSSRRRAGSTCGSRDLAMTGCRAGCAPSNCGPSLTSIRHAQGTHFQLANVLKRLGKKDDAEKHERRFQELEKSRSALEIALVALLKEPGSAARHFELGRLHVSAGQGAKAERYFHRPST